MPGRHPLKPKAGVAAKTEQPTECTPLKPQVHSKAEDAENPVSLLENPVLWLKTLSQTYSWRLLAMVVCTNHMLKGFVAGGGDEGLVGKPIEFLLGDLNVSAGRLQMLKAAAIAPWALKPVIALLSDTLPIFGYKKMPYVVITTVMSFVACLALGKGLVSTTPFVVACLFLIFLQISTVDLLVVAKQSEEVKQNAKHGPQFFTFSWLGINVGQVASTCALGPLLHHYGPNVPYLIAAPLIALVLWPTLGNFLREKPIPLEDRGCNLHMIRKHPELCSLTLLIGCLIISLIFATFLIPEEHIICFAVSFAGLVLAGFHFFVRPEITGPVIFYFMLTMLSFNVDGALFYFYTDPVENYPAGPHFTAYFYTTALGAGTFLGVMAGFLSGSELFKEWSYRGILKLTILLRVMTQLLLVPVLLRWTAVLGIPDKLWVLVVIMLDSVFFAWRWIPKQVMGAHLTPRGAEATMIGLSAGTFNMAMILSSYCGGFLLNKYGVTPTGSIGETMVFAGLWKVQVLAALAPCSMLLLLPALIPAKSQTEPLLMEHDDSATHGSAFETLRRRHRSR